MIWYCTVILFYSYCYTIQALVIPYTKTWYCPTLCMHLFMLHNSSCMQQLGNTIAIGHPQHVPATYLSHMSMLRPSQMVHHFQMSCEWLHPGQHPAVTDPNHHTCHHRWPLLLYLHGFQLGPELLPHHLKNLIYLCQHAISAHLWMCDPGSTTFQHIQTRTLCNSFSKVFLKDS